MIITFLDGSKKAFEKGVTSLDIANSISSSLAKKSVFMNCTFLQWTVYWKKKRSWQPCLKSH